MSQSSLTQPLAVEEARREQLPATIELRYPIEIALADRLLANTAQCSGAGQPDHERLHSNGLSDSAASIVLRIEMVSRGPASARWSMSLARGARMVAALGARDIDLAVTRTGRMIHLDGTCRAFGPLEANGRVLALSIDGPTGRVIYACTTLPAQLGLPGGTYDPPHATIEW